MAVVAAVVLAAGEASRFGAPKQHILLPRVLDRLADAPVDEIVVVEGAHPLEPCDDQLQGSVPCRVVRCDAWARGPGASLRCGLAVLAAEIEAAVVILADGPQLAPKAVERVIDVWRQGAGPVVAASYDGARGHPLVVARSAWKDLPDQGLRVLDAVLVPCDDLGAPGDVDRPEDLPLDL
jgi:CTP:molybdopterin cytidylyltransferase MocA